MIGHTFSIEPVWCDEHNCFEQALRVNTYDTSRASKPKSVEYPLHNGGMQQLFLNLANHVGSAYIPSSPAARV